ncbi:MAG: FMN-binding glutamate synthase family protein [Fluviicola sp.]|nr:FMN-binding glutamate synthase family protein [Fluviicola sp.]
MNVRQSFILISIIILASIGAVAYLWWQPIVWSLLFFGPVILIGVRDIFSQKHTLKSNFPVVGNFRYILEKLRPGIMQYFVETDTQGRPISRIFRTLIYQRAKNVTDTVPFGTQMKVYSTGYEWMDHSMYACSDTEVDHAPRVTIGGKDCKQPYSASILNISAMSFGSLSNRAVLAMNKGAKIGGFAQNTGEGGVSPYHLENGGDLIWQVGTGYFGCRAKDGGFDVEGYKKTVSHESIKMVELKLSQGAKPGHGGILPAKKNTQEIANIRHVEPFTDVHSPPSHSAFNSAEGLMEFIKVLRDNSNGKPIGFKLCVGKQEEFIGLCKAMISTGIKPDFITVDGGEGGTGAAPVEFSNSIGMPLRDGLAFVSNALIGYDLKKDIKVIASGKIISSFHIARTIALGADLVNSARAMMMATGCIQALQCNTNTCPVGVATQDKGLIRGLNVEDKAKRVANFHYETLKNFAELIAATGILNPSDLTKKHINRRVSYSDVLNYEEIFPTTEVGSFLK